MPMYYFNLHDSETLHDTEGTNLADLAAARGHAADVARELTFKSRGMLRQGWTQWTLRVRDDQDVELFAVALADFDNGNGNGNSKK